VIGMATGLGPINAGVSSFTLAVTSLSMALIPALSLLARRLARKLEPPKRWILQSLCFRVAASRMPSSSATGASEKSSARC
jgi:hypothetical protein